MTTITNRAIDFAARNNGKIAMLLSLIYIAIIILGIPNLSFVATQRIFFSNSDISLINFDEFEDRYGSTYSVDLLLKINQGSVLDKNNIEAIKKIADESRQLDNVVRVSSIADYPIVVSDADTITTNSVIDILENNKEGISKNIYNEILNDRSVIGWLLSKDNKMTRVNIEVNFNSDDAAKRLKLMEDINKLKSSWESVYGDRLSFSLFGNLAVDNEIESLAIRDGKNIFSAMFLLVITVCALLLKSIRGALIVYISMLFSAVMVCAIAGFCRIPLNAGNVPSIFAVMYLALLDACHLITVIRTLELKGEWTDRINQTFMKIYPPAIMTALTACAGLLALGFSPSPPFAQLGFLTATGIVCGLGFTFIVIPAILVKFPQILIGKKQEITKPVTSKYVEVYIKHILPFILKNFKYSLSILAILMLLSLYSLSHAVLDDKLGLNFSKSNPINVATREFSEKLTVGQMIEISIDTGKDGGVYDGEFLTRASVMEEWILKQNGVTYIKSIIPILKTVNQKLGITKDRSLCVSGVNNCSLAESYFMYELSLPAGQTVNNVVSMDKRYLRISVATTDLSTADILGLRDSFQEYFDQNFKNEKIIFTGASLMAFDLGKRNSKLMIMGDTAAVIVISILLFLQFRSAVFSIATIIPNIIPPIYVFGLWTYFGGVINMPAAVVYSIALGMIIDDSVYFFLGYKSKREAGYDMRESLNEVYRTSGVSMVLSSTALISGFLFAGTFSSLQSNAVIYLLLSMCIAVGLITEFIFTPAVVVVVERFNNRKFIKA